jgi:hypothetical protein
MSENFIPSANVADVLLDRISTKRKDKPPKAEMLTLTPFRPSILFGGMSALISSVSRNLSCLGADSRLVVTVLDLFRIVKLVNRHCTSHMLLFSFFCQLLFGTTVLNFSRDVYHRQNHEFELAWSSGRNCTSLSPL